jgi:hypothetical protein
VWFRRKEEAKPIPAEVSRQMREQALQITPGELGLAWAGDRGSVWGVVMETGSESGAASLVTFDEGTTSMYFSNGGGVIGAGEHAPVRAASFALLASANQHLDSFSTVSETPLPDVGRVRFYLRTYEGLRGAEASQDDLAYGRHPLSPVFNACHIVITALREATEKQQQQKKR